MKNKSFQISGNIIDVIDRKIYPGTIIVTGEKISHIVENPDNRYSTYYFTRPN